MDASIAKLCHLIKQSIEQFIQKNQPFAFNLLIGKKNQGKSNLFEADSSSIVQPINESGINFIQNKHGIIIEFNENWLINQDKLLAPIIKKINSCSPITGITGIIYCIDINNILLNNPTELTEIIQDHLKLLNRFGNALKKRIDLNIFFTKMDLVTGFTEYFLNDHQTEFSRPLGFSLKHNIPKKDFFIHLDKQFDLFVDSLNQKVIHKLHPVRSLEKRTLIREFPLQIASLKKPIQFILLAIDNKIFNIKTICFSSTRQDSSNSISKLDRKISENCALITVKKNLAPVTNKRSYFAGGALRASLAFTKTSILPPSFKQKAILFSGIGILGLIMVFFTTNNWYLMRKINSSQQALATFNVLHQQHAQPLTALYHLLQAESLMTNLSDKMLRHLSLASLKFDLSSKLEQQIDRQFLPFIFHDLEQIMTNPEEPPIIRYHALKIYLMLNEPHYRDNQVIINWYKEHWQRTTTNSLMSSNLNILTAVLNKYKNTALPINFQLVRDTRNYLNAIPADYFYYQLIKNNLPKTQTAILLPNWHLSSQNIPDIFLYENFSSTINTITNFASKYSNERWILERQDFNNISINLQKAYCREYVTWWQNFLEHASFEPIDSYHTAQIVSAQLIKNKSLSNMLNFVKHNVAPKSNAIFNQNIATNFSALLLINEEQITNLSKTIQDLTSFLKTLDLVAKDKKTIFELTLNRFNNDFATDTLSQLYLQIRQLPAPLSNWLKLYADQIWYLFIKDSKIYLNSLWRKQVMFDYNMSIANHYPLSPKATNYDLSLDAFNHFFAPRGVILNFLNQYLRPFINTNNPGWVAKEKNGFVMPFKTELLQALMRANVISTMFFHNNRDQAHIEFSLQKLELDPVIHSIQIRIGEEQLIDTPSSDSFAQFTWPANNAYVMIKNMQGRTYDMAESGDWAFFKLLQKMNVYLDENEQSLVKILFEINGNQAHYVLKTNNSINPFSPGILNNFNLSENLF